MINMTEIEGLLTRAVNRFQDADAIALSINPETDPAAFDRAWQARLTALEKVGVYAAVWATQKANAEAGGKS